MKTLKITLFALLMAATTLVSAEGPQSKISVNKSVTENNKEVVLKFNKAYWESGNVEIIKSLMVHFITGFRKGFSDVTVEFSEVLGEGVSYVQIRQVTNAIVPTRRFEDQRRKR
ncbi:MAG TPA: hypothetical protein VFE32_13825 [Puia sp.]|nr:hypothetical protein [Puia sp.]